MKCSPAVLHCTELDPVPTAAHMELLFHTIFVG
jgi:hypothetical protein